jgi:glycerol uptake facilitator-like aquaporin
MYNSAVAEFLGTSLLLGAISFTPSPALIIAAFAIAVGFTSKISGAHINPAVTLSALLSGKIGQQKAISYILAQVSAAIFIYLIGSVVKV